MITHKKRMTDGLKWKGVGEEALPPGGEMLVIVAEHGTGEEFSNSIARTGAESAKTTDRTRAR